jgi:hypothetical protein
MNLLNELIDTYFMNDMEDAYYDVIEKLIIYDFDEDEWSSMGMLSRVLNGTILSLPSPHLRRFSWWYGLLRVLRMGRIEISYFTPKEGISRFVDSKIPLMRLGFGMSGLCLNNNMGKNK